jgi:hypothetical protein
MYFIFLVVVYYALFPRRLHNLLYFLRRLYNILYLPIRLYNRPVEIYILVCDKHTHVAMLNMIMIYKPFYLTDLDINIRQT